MKLRRRRFGSCLGLAIGLCIQLVGAGAAHAGAWNRAQWGYFLQLGTAFTSATNRYTGSGDRTRIQVAKNGDPQSALAVGSNANDSNYQQLLSDLYFEVGLLKRLTVFGDLGFVSSRQTNEGGQLQYRARGIGDLMFGARVQILELPVAFALETRLFVPTGDALDVIPLGSGDFRGEIRLALGKSWSRLKLPLYFDVEVGVMLRGAATVRDTASIDFTYQIPDDLPSGLYAARMSAGASIDHSQSSRSSS